MAPAVLIAGFNLLSGLPSMESLTKLSNKLSLGLMSPKLLFDIFRVFIWYNVITESGSFSILLLCKSSTPKFGHLSRFDKAVSWLKAKRIWSSLGELGMELSSVNWF